jgi:hypothetical protein
VIDIEEDRMLFVVSEDRSNIEMVDSQSFLSLNVWERRDIQEWVRKYPEILGEDLLIVSMEFDRFEGSRDRLDLLALDRSGNLVVVELKRDSFAGYADLQSIRYAAMISTMTIEQLLPYFAAYHKSTFGETASDEELRANLSEFVNLDEELKELPSRPRVILCSEDFSQEITTTVLWLRGFDLDISCVRITPHRLDNKIVLVPEKIIPLRESEQYIIEVQKKEEERQEATKGKTAYTLEELQAKADQSGTGEGFRAILQAAEKHPELSLRTKFYVVRIAPSSNRVYSLCVIGPSSSVGGLSINVYSEIWAKFFDVDEATLAEILGPNRFREGVTNEEAKEFSVNLDRLLKDIEQRAEEPAGTEPQEC